MSPYMSRHEQVHVAAACGGEQSGDSGRAGGRSRAWSAISSRAFPNEQAATKVPYLVATTRPTTKISSRGSAGWKQILNALTIHCRARLEINH